MNLQQLNTRFAIKGQLAVVAGEGGFPCIEVSNRHARARVSVYGGQVLSFRPLDVSEDLLFVSTASQYREGKAIRGGIPVCWPWFGADPEDLGRPSHGLVRNRLWRVLETDALPDGETRIVLGTGDSDDTRAMWPHAFDLRLQITVGSTLGLALVTRNTGDKPFRLTQALHTYFRVADIDRVRVLGLEDTAYIDKTSGGKRNIQSGATTVDTEVDRIYTDVRRELLMVDQGLDRRVRITATGSRTAVVWNPWKHVAEKMADLEAADYRRFICVETANAADEVIEIAPGGEYHLGTHYRIERGAGSSA
ncbi:MAG: D-hexose-6-phosphate mutarotase [Gammaproteobacteria bacterium]|jgi:glucose-6-phosphate 1-epimerase